MSFRETAKEQELLPSPSGFSALCASQSYLSCARQVNSLPLVLLLLDDNNNNVCGVLNVAIELLLLANLG